MKSLSGLLKVVALLLLLGIGSYAIYYTMQPTNTERPPLRYEDRAFTWKVKPPADSVAYYKITASAISYSSDSTFALTIPVEHAPVQFTEISGFQEGSIIFTINEQKVDEPETVRMDGFLLSYFDTDKPATILMEYRYPESGYSAIYQAHIYFSPEDPS